MGKSIMNEDNKSKCKRDYDDVSHDEDKDDKSTSNKKLKSEPNSDSDDDEGEVCLKCGLFPCDLLRYKVTLENEHHRIVNDKTYEGKENNIKRKRLYKSYIEANYGHLGKNVRVPISPCITDYVRYLFPSADGNYMGFKET